MTTKYPTQAPGDKLKKAIQLLSELLETQPEKTRLELLHQVEIQLDLSPRECEFLNNHFDEKKS